jgi:hypothetical protein
MIKIYYRAEYFTGFCDIYCLPDDKIKTSESYEEVLAAIQERKKTFKNRQYRIVFVKEKVVYTD